MRYELVPVASIDRTWGPRPTERIVEHVRRHGVLVPVLLAEVADNDGVLVLRIVDGNRRVAAARELDLDEIPAIVVSADDATLAELTLATNTLRTGNAVTEWWAIDDLHQAGIADRTIAEHTGMTPATLKARARYGDLDPRLFSGLVYGKIAPTVIEKAARLPQEAQDRLGELFHQKGMLQTWQVEDEAKHYRQPRTTAPPSVPVPPSFDRDDDPFPPDDDFPPDNGFPLGNALSLEGGSPSDDGFAPESPLGSNVTASPGATSSQPNPLVLRLAHLARAARDMGIDRDAWLRHATEAFDSVSEGDNGS